jgi:hypothetical protein
MYLNSHLSENLSSPLFRKEGSNSSLSHPTAGALRMGGKEDLMSKYRRVFKRGIMKEAS